MNLDRVLALGLAASTAFATSVAASPAVVADIAATHSIVARVMAGVGEPNLLLPPRASPHGYAIRPSEASTLEAAEIVFWIGPAYTPWLAGPIEAIASDARRVALERAPGVDLLPVREGGPFGDAAYDHRGDEDRGNEDEHQHPGGVAAADGHLWLDPLNAAAIAFAAADVLAEADRANAARYQANADAFAEDMRALVAEIEVRLAPAAGRRFVVFHDAYQYFENRFRLPASGSIALHDAEQPSPARMVEIRERIRIEDVACVFAEPQFPASLVETAIEGTGARRGTLDPIGVRLDPGPSFYPSLIRALAENMLACLAPEAAERAY